MFDDYDVPVLEINFHFPHDRFGLLYSYLPKDEDHDYITVEFVIFIMTLRFNL